MAPYHVAGRGRGEKDPAARFAVEEFSWERSRLFRQEVACAPDRGRAGAAAASAADDDRALRSESAGAAARAAATALGRWWKGQVCDRSLKSADNRERVGQGAAHPGQLRDDSRRTSLPSFPLFSRQPADPCSPGVGLLRSQ